MTQTAAVPASFSKALAPVLAVRAYLQACFPERQAVIDGILAAMMSGQHVLLLGQPGTAKSALIRAVSQAFGGRYFERLLTKFSVPEELFGPVSLKGLEQDQYTRITRDRLPEAEFGYVDETFKASSAILNTLLALMNERKFHNDTAVMDCPLVSLFGASNELPEAKELEALFDRFLIRFDVRYLVQDTNFRAMVLTEEFPECPQYTMQDLRTAQQAVKTVKITDETVDALVEIRRALAADGIIVSDRRWKQTLGVVRAYCALLDQTASTPEDLTVLVDMLWREPKDRARIARTVGRIADPVSFQVAEVVDAAREASQKAQALRASNQDSFLQVAKQTLDQFRQQQVRLDGLASKAGPRARQAVQDGQAEIKSLHGELARALAAGMGLGVGRAA